LVFIAHWFYALANKNTTVPLTPFKYRKVVKSLIRKSTIKKGDGVGGKRVLRHTRRQQML